MAFIPVQPTGGVLYFANNHTFFKGDRFQVAESVLSWLIREDIIKPEKCVVRLQQNGHRFSEGIKRVVAEPFPDIDSDFNGLEYSTERQFLCWHQYFHYIICPNCKSDLEQNSEHEDFFMEAVWQWKDRDGADFIHCPICCQKTFLCEFKIGHECMFSDLVFSFFGCRGVTDTFRTEFEQRLGNPVRLFWWPTV